MNDAEKLALINKALALPLDDVQDDHLREMRDGLLGKVEDWHIEDREAKAFKAWAGRQPLETAAVELLGAVAQAVKVFPGRKCSNRHCNRLAESSRYCEADTAWRARSRASGYNLAFEHGEGGF